MNILKEFRLNDKCSYLDNKEQTMHYKIIEDCDAQETQAYIERGFRRFGKTYFRPICQGCNECQSIKIDVANFKFSKSARRILKKGTFITSIIQKPSLTQEHIKLFEKYHLYMQDLKGWSYTPTAPENYYNSFVSGHGDFGYEVLYFDEEKLIGVDLIDILDDGISSIYFYYDPDYMKYSLGKLSLYQQIKYAKVAEKDWIYLGYYVQDCPSLSYKSQYKPYLTLEGNPSMSEDFSWR